MPRDSTSGECGGTGLYGTAQMPKAYGKSGGAPGDAAPRGEAEA
jgi:hypothetical protein